MPRAKANPDPAVITHERADMPGVVFTITATRAGAYSVERDGKVLFALGPQLGAYGGAPLHPSNRMQDEAIAAAKLRIATARLDALK
jgi:hypothetical protein